MGESFISCTANGELDHLVGETRAVHRREFVTVEDQGCLAGPSRARMFQGPRSPCPITGCSPGSERANVGSQMGSKPGSKSTVAR